MSPILEATSLYRFFHSGDDEVLALRGVSLSVEAGEMVAVVGPSGSGKSTLLHCLAGLDEPDAGMARVAGGSTSRRSEAFGAAVRARHIGMLFQADNLLGHLTVDDNLALVQRLAARPDVERRRRLLSQLGVEGRARAYPAQLSGGEAARAALAVALANDPDVLLADEPTGEVDSMTETRLVALRERARAGTAVVVASHSRALAAEVDRSLLLVDGVVA